MAKASTTGTILLVSLVRILLIFHNQLDPSFSFHHFFSCLCMKYVDVLKLVAGNILDGSNGDIAVDHYHRYLVT